ncbi:hypothetical protein BDF14DRAFT_1875317 [Spinellus fusiger]|nr:hypothetical protein BDF14DRAFT_1875317 [Spinellus fusiger]
MATTQQQIETCLLQQQRQQQDIYRLQLMCSDRQMALDTCSFKIVSLEKDLKAIHLKCLEEESQIKSIQHFKDTAKRELEELGQGLFEEARQMVLREQHEKQHLKVHHDKTQTDLEAMHHHLAATQSELEALRETMAIKEQTQDTQDTQTPVLGTACERTQMELAQWHGLPLLAQVAVPHKDSAVLTDFDVFVSALPTLSLRRMHSLPFMKQCLRDDIEPCLRLGPNALITSRKVLEAVLVKTCFVEKCPPALAYPAHAKQDTAATTASLWERFQFSPPTARCQACGREQGPFSYRFRISYFDEWATIDRYCRDRIASVIAFYDYLSRLKAGAYYHWPLGTVYEECKRLRLQMCLSRMGALPAMLMASGVDPTVIGKASVSSTPDNKMSNHTRPIVSQLSSFTDSILTVSTFHSHA